VRELDYASSILLGVIQGITEFLPISSSAHLALSQRWMGIAPDSPAMLLFDVMVHVGSLAAVLVVFRTSVGQFVRTLVIQVRGRGRHEPRAVAGATLRKNLPRGILTDLPALRILFLGVVACVPTGVIGLAFKDSFEAAFDNPVLIGTCLMITGFLLIAMARVRRGWRGWRTFRWWQAGLVGLAQAGAILPGISRSGATICVASFLGLRRRWAAEFSFLIAVPAILGGTLFKLRDTFGLEAEAYAGIPWGAIMVGSLTSFVVGIAALRLLVYTVRRAKLHHFAWYCWVLGLVVLLTM
jgi:undecaprenyl-diphosphatase